MRYVLAALLFSLPLFAQSPDQPGFQYSAYTILLVSHQKGMSFFLIDGSGLADDKRLPCMGAAGILLYCGHFCRN
jgi:hypothetical protein